MILIRHALFWHCTSVKLIFIILGNILCWLWNFYQSLDSLLVTVWGFMLMKTFVSTSCMFPVRISCFNEGIFYSDAIQHVIMVDGFYKWYNIDRPRLRCRVARSIYCTKKAKNFSLLFQISSWDIKRFLADLLSIFSLNSKHLRQKLFFDFVNLF